MSVPVFKELDKTATDLLDKGFPLNSVGFELEGAASNGIKFKATGTHLPEGNADALFETTKVLPDVGVSIKASAKTAKATPTYIGEVTYEPKAVEGLKTTLTTEVTGVEKRTETPKLAVLYKRGQVTSETVISYPGHVEAASSIAVARQAFRAGFNSVVSYAPDSEKKVTLKEYSFKAGYVPNKTLALTAIWATAGQTTKAGANLWYKSERHNIETAGSITANPFALGELPVFRLVAQYQHDATTTLKARFNSVGTVGFALKQQLSDAVSVTVSSECVPNVAAKSSAHKYGATFNVKL